MKKNTFLHIKSSLFILILIVLIISIASCSKDNYDSDPYFSIEGSPTELTSYVAGITQSFVVRSNRSWEIKEVSDSTLSWLTIFPKVGEDDGIFKVTVSKNKTFDARSVDLAFYVNGEEESSLLHISQEANTPEITVDDSILSVVATGGDLTVNVSANVDWTYTQSDSSWLTVDSVSSTQITLTAEENSGEIRYDTLTIQSAEYPDLNKTVVIEQLAGNVLIDEDFSWLSYGSSVPYVTTGETRFDSWTTDEQDHGWSVTENTYASDQQCVYARQGFIKLGKTGYGGDIISDKLSSIEGTVNLKVTFKAAVYISASGTVDSNVLKVYALNAGTTSVSQFEIDNIPNDQADDDAGVVNDIWSDDRAYSFTVTGATNETQIKFLGGDYNLSGGKNRIFLDDITVEIVP